MTWDKSLPTTSQGSLKLAHELTKKEAVEILQHNSTDIEPNWKKIETLRERLFPHRARKPNTIFPELYRLEKYLWQGKDSLEEKLALAKGLLFSNSTKLVHIHRSPEVNMFLMKYLPSQELQAFLYILVEERYHTHGAIDYYHTVSRGFFENEYFIKEKSLITDQQDLWLNAARHYLLRNSVRTDIAFAWAKSLYTKPELFDYLTIDRAVNLLKLFTQRIALDDLSSIEIEYHGYNQYTVTIQQIFNSVILRLQALVNKQAKDIGFEGVPFEEIEALFDITFPENDDELNNSYTIASWQVGFHGDSQFYPAY